MTDVSRSLTIDAGQTGIRALLRSADGRHDTFDFAGIRTDRELMPQLADVVKAVAATESGLSDDLGIRTLSAGISGFTQSDADAAELALSVRTGLERVGQSVVDAPVIGGLGGVLRSPEIATRFERDLRLVWPAADIRFPTANGLDGAALLPNLPATSAVLSLVARSRA
ncbi:hypothetical protein [Cryobacterium sp. 10I5]|uniref:hypothetical protein n=1 Tax=Cryobacterium sp. 10I5 TaxID=3048581 RepID=UPI002B231276|nr:hypothetical protein [Cryobacterium sp. 10I5]MEB0267391.1 hypothetical protein [Cryobacterium sp. 10I5]